MRCCLVVVVAVVSFSWSSWCARMSAWVFFFPSSLCPTPISGRRSLVFMVWGSFLVVSCWLRLMVVVSLTALNHLLFISSFFLPCDAGYIKFFFCLLSFFDYICNTLKYFKLNSELRQANTWAKPTLAEGIIKILRMPIKNLQFEILQIISKYVHELRRMPTNYPVMTYGIYTAMLSYGARELRKVGQQIWMR